MIDIENNMLHVPGQEPEPILEWVVYFISIEGVHATREEALESCKKTGQPPSLILPIPAAKGANTFEVCLTAGAVLD